MELLNSREHDGSRCFAGLPQRGRWPDFSAHLAKLAGAVETAFVTDGVVEGWLDFEYCGQQFSVNNQLAAYWFFVSDPTCDEAVLRRVVEHFAAILGEKW